MVRISIRVYRLSKRLARKMSKKKKEITNRQTFWAEEVHDFLVECGRQDLVDRGDALAERVSALIMTAMGRLEQYIKEGDLYNGRGGTSLMAKPEALAHMDEFVNKRLQDEVEVLEQLLETFDDLREREPVSPTPNLMDSLPKWY
jgi:DNA-binding ferritin-like protein